MRWDISPEACQDSQNINSNADGQLLHAVSLRLLLQTKPTPLDSDHNLER